MTTYTMDCETAHYFITPTGFLLYAKDYLSAAKNWKIGEQYSPVPYFLCCMSIELGFKAFILAKSNGVNLVNSNGENIIKNNAYNKEYVRTKIGHDLVTALAKAISLTLNEFVSTTPEEEKQLQNANYYYNKGKGFEYFSIEKFFSEAKLPDIEILKQYSEKLLRDIEQFVLSNV